MARTRRQSRFALHLAGQLRAHLDDNGLSVGKFADRHGIARPNLYKLMDGTTTDPSVYLCEQIAAGLGLQIHLLRPRVARPKRRAR